MICEWYQSLILKLQFDLHVFNLYVSVDLSAINCVSPGKSPSAWNHTLCNCLLFHNCDFMIFSIYRYVHMTYSRRLKLCHYSVNILTGRVVSICDIHSMHIYLSYQRFWGSIGLKFISCRIISNHSRILQFIKLVQKNAHQFKMALKLKSTPIDHIDLSSIFCLCFWVHNS